MTNDEREAAAARIEALASEIAALRREIAGQTADATEAPSSAVPLHTANSVRPDDAATPEPDGPALSRRGALLALGGAAGGVGLALGATVLGAAPADATTNPMYYGADNDAGTAITTLTTDTAPSNTALFVTNTGTDSYSLVGVVGAQSTLLAPGPGAGVTGTTNGSGPGVQGLSDSGQGVFGGTGGDGSSGVEGFDHSSGGGTALTGISQAGYGAFLSGGHVPLALQPGGVAGPPTTGSHVTGELYVDSTGKLYYCYADDLWVALTNGNFPIPPVRVLDTTTGLGGVTGPLSPATTVHTSTAIAGTHGIPQAAVGIVANLAISGVGGALLNGYGVATIFPAGGAVPATANINAGAGCFATSNSVNLGLGTGGAVSIVWNGGGPVPDAHAFLDVTGYIL